MLFEEQIKKLINNIPKYKNKQYLDIVLEGGGFNGSYELGVLYFVREMEIKEYVKVERISGASIGALVGLCYLLDDLDRYINMYQKVREMWRKDNNLKIIIQLVNEICKDIDDESFNKLKKDKLYITYYSLNERKQIIKSNYENKDELRDSIIKSCFIPFILDNDIGFKSEGQYFIDGGQPYIFKVSDMSNLREERKILYISINQISKLKNMLITTNEYNAYGRVLRGLLESYDFFMNINESINKVYSKKTEFCSFVNEWSIYDYLGLYIKQIIIILFVNILNYFDKLWKLVYPLIDKLEVYHMIKPVMNNLYKDVILYMCF